MPASGLLCLFSVLDNFSLSSFVTFSSHAPFSGLLTFNNTARTTGIPEANAASHFGYVCYAAIRWPFKIASKFWNCYAAIRFSIFGFPILDSRIHVNAAIAKVNVGC